MSNFIFFNNVFYAIFILKSLNSHFSVIACSFFEIGTDSKWCIREWVKNFDCQRCEFLGPAFYWFPKALKALFKYKEIFAEPHSSVGSGGNLRTGGRWFDPRLDQYFFRGLVIVISTLFLPHCCPLAWKECFEECWLNEPQESMDSCTDRRDITEILLKTALNTINQSLDNILVRNYTAVFRQD